MVSDALSVMQAWQSGMQGNGQQQCKFALLSE